MGTFIRDVVGPFRVGANGSRVMRIAKIAAGFGSLWVLLALAAGLMARNEFLESPATATTAVTQLAAPPPTSSAHEAFLYGRVTMENGDVYEGRLRFGGDEEALWGNYFNAVKKGNAWAAQAPHELLTERVPVRLFGFTIAHNEREIDLGRPFMVRFGDIARIDAPGRELRVTLKSGTTFDLARFGADDFADGVRVWDSQGGVVDLDEWDISSIEFLPAAGSDDDISNRLYGTVRTRTGEFTGFVQWNRKHVLGSDELVPDGADMRSDHRLTRSDLSLTFDDVRSIERRSERSSLVTLVDGREVLVSDPRESYGNSGMYVDDPRYGRVLVSWDAFERVDFSLGVHGPAYRDFPAGQPITGTVVTREGRRLTGRLVYDLDESESTETLDAPAEGVDYMFPFGLVASIQLPEGRGDQRARVTLHSGEWLLLGLSGDLAGNAGMLIFTDGSAHPDFVRWTDIAQIDLDRPTEMYPSVSR
jgi:hypothetical protein